MKTLARRIALPVALFLVWTPAAHAWSWPLQGPVLQSFAYDQAHPYASGQHRGIDIGAAATGDEVGAPASGTVSFAGTVPTNGKSVTIETPDGYAVTLTHLGSILVSNGGTVAEGDSVGTVGPSGTPEVDVPYVHLGIRLAADPNGYVDPLGLLPAQTAEGPPADTGSPVPQPSASGGPATTPVVTEPAPASPPVATTRGSTVTAGGAAVAHQRPGRAQRPRPEASRPASHLKAGQQAEHRVRAPHRRATEPTSTWRRPVVEAAAPLESSGVETRPSAPVAPVRTVDLPVSLVSLLCNGVAALIAAAAAVAAARRRRGRAGASPHAGAEVLHLPRPAREQRRAA